MSETVIEPAVPGTETVEVTVPGAPLVEVHQTNTDNQTIYYEGMNVQLVPGPQGAVGPVGPRGLSLYSGEGAPTFEAQTGETYVDVATGTVYEWQ